MRRFLNVLASAALLLTIVPTLPAVASGEAPVLAKYYAWFDGNTWGSGQLTDQPAALYSSADRGAIERQVAQAQSAGIDGFTLDWWGPGNPTDSNLQALLSVAKAKGFKVTVDVDLNSPFLNSSGDVTHALSYLKRYFGDPAWFKYNRRPVVSFYGIRKYDVGTWASIRGAAGDEGALWIGEGDIFTYLQIFDGMHPYSVAWSPDPSSQLASYASRTRAYGDKLWVATVMPGYNDTRLGRPDGFSVDRQGGAYYQRMWQGAIATRPAFISITSWNEWLEGSQIEPSKSYGDLFLRLTREGAAAVGVAGDATTPATPTANVATGDGAFYTEAGEGKGGYAVTNRDGVGLFSSFRALGGVEALGFPATQRFQRGGFIYQAMQGAVLQWRPEYGRAVPANTMEWFSEAGKDDWLLQTAGVPQPIDDDGSSGNWAAAKQTRFGWMTDDAIRQQFLSSDSLDRAIEMYGLPMSRPERHGPFITQRFQRITFQHWVEAVPGMPAPGSVVRVLAGDLLKRAGILPAEAIVPSAS